MGRKLSPTARRSICALALVVGVAGAIALPAAASASHGKQAPQHRTHGSTVVKVVDGTAALGGTTSTKVGNSAAVLGPAVKYVRMKDGTVRQVR
jgi:hypothetical protein